jgi:adrenodoxin-NADP+ reductase
VIHKFATVAQAPQVNLLANVPVGTSEISLDEVRQNYHAVVLSYGTSLDSELGIPGEHLQNVLSGRTFVGWYNGHPDYTRTIPNLDSDTALILGHGNVALDIARILLKPLDELKQTDIPESVLQHLSQSKVKHVKLIGRRGPGQVAFTAKELRELINLSHVTGYINHEQVNEANEIDGPALSRSNTRILGLFKKLSQLSGSDFQNPSWSAEFQLSPLQFLGSSRVEGVRFVQNQLIRENSKVYAVPDPAKLNVEFAGGLAVKAIGYKAQPMAGHPFDVRRGCIPNDLGRVQGDGAGLYVAGWLKHGPTGDLAATMREAYETADTLVKDFETQNEHINSTVDLPNSVQSILKRRGTYVIDWKGWCKIEEEEQRRGGRKLTDVQEMIGIAQR